MGNKKTSKCSKKVTIFKPVNRNRIFNGKVKKLTAKSKIKLHNRRKGQSTSKSPVNTKQKLKDRKLKMHYSSDAVGMNGRKAHIIKRGKETLFPLTEINNISNLALSQS